VANRVSSIRKGGSGPRKKVRPLPSLLGCGDASRPKEITAKIKLSSLEIAGRIAAVNPLQSGTFRNTRRFASGWDGAGVPHISTVHDHIAEADRQIERMKLRVQQQIVHTDNLEHGHFEPEAKRAHALLNRMMEELSQLQQYRLKLYQQAVLEKVPEHKAS
jgi:hypothetical protein